MGKNLLSHPYHRIVSAKYLSEIKDTLGKVVITTGTFDYPQHYLHYRYLASAKSLGDTLVVLMDSDKLAKERKGNSRPHITFKTRAITLLWTQHVDYVVELDISNHTILDISSIKLIKPNVYVQSENTNEPPQNKMKKYKILKKLEINLVYFPQNNVDISTTSLTKSLITSHLW